LKAFSKLVGQFRFKNRDNSEFASADFAYPEARDERYMRAGSRSGPAMLGMVAPAFAARLASVHYKAADNT
jgi:hypothetical protein